MEVRVIYASLTGNTARVARAIADALGVDPEDIRDLRPRDLSDAGLLFVGDGVYGRKPSRRMVRFLSSLPEIRGTAAAVFGTYGARPSQLPVLKRLLTKKGAEVVGEFACPGKDWFTLGLLRRGRPNEADLERARAFAVEIARKVGSL
ncbi:flavodoxin family protein [Candidatus Bipolaricaulota sp. J31]